MFYFGLNYLAKRFQ